MVKEKQQLFRQAYSWGTLLSKHKFYFIDEPRHEISNNVVVVTTKASDQPAHMRSLIRAFAGRLNIL